MKPARALILSLALIPAIALPAQAKHAPKAAIAAPKPDASGQDLDIAAVVGDEAVSSYDVENRIKFIIATANLSNTADVRERIRPQVIRSLIDEKLQLQEAARNDITISDKDIADAIAGIEAQRAMPPGAIDQILETNHVPKATFTQQIHAQLAWNRLLIKKIRPQVRISEEEITLASKHFTAPASASAKIPQELQIAVINLPVDKPAREKEVGRLAEKLVREIRNGASFEEISRQFSSAAASAGGKVEAFWVAPGQLAPAIVKGMGGTKPGEITDPIRTDEGYTVIKIYNARAAGGGEGEKSAQTEVLLKAILLKLKPDADHKEADVLLQIGEDVAKHPGACDEKGIANIKDLGDFDIEVEFHRTLLTDLPPALRIIAENLKVGDISTPFASYEGIRLYMLCDRKEAQTKPLDSQQVSNMLLQQKMELEAQKYMRNLRRETYIDIR